MVVLFALPAAAHTRAELEVWVGEWTARADHALSPGLTAEMEDMRFRHIWYFAPQTAEDAPYGGSIDSGRNTSKGWPAGPTVERWRHLLGEYFDSADVDHGLCIIAGESGGDPTIDNRQGSSAAGLWQFLRSTWDNMVPRSVTGGSYDSGEVYNPRSATRAAAWLAYNVGWSQWNADRGC